MSLRVLIIGPDAGHHLLASCLMESVKLGSLPLHISAVKVEPCTQLNEAVMLMGAAIREMAVHVARSADAMRELRNFTLPKLDDLPVFEKPTNKVPHWQRHNKQPFYVGIKKRRPRR